MAKTIKIFSLASGAIILVIIGIFATIVIVQYIRFSRVPVSMNDKFSEETNIAIMELVDLYLKTYYSHFNKGVPEGMCTEELQNKLETKDRYSRTPLKGGASRLFWYSRCKFRFLPTRPSHFQKNTPSRGLLPNAERNSNLLPTRF